jgi:hypothetical protein
MALAKEIVSIDIERDLKTKENLNAEEFKDVVCSLLLSPSVLFVFTTSSLPLDFCQSSTLFALLIIFALSVCSIDHLRTLVRARFTLWFVHFCSPHLFCSFLQLQVCL